MPNKDLNIALIQLEKVLRSIVRDEISKLLTKSTRLQSGQFNSTKDRVIKYRFGWTKDKSILRVLYGLLKNFGFIECDYQSFEDIFLGNGESIRIRWCRPTYLLAHLFSCLQLHFIPKSANVNKLLNEHFLDKRGKVPTIEVLKSSISQITNRNSTDIDNIIVAIRRLEEENNKA